MFMATFKFETLVTYVNSMHSALSQGTAESCSLFFVQGVWKKSITLNFEFLVRFLLIIQLKVMLLFQKPCIYSIVWFSILNLTTKIMFCCHWTILKAEQRYQNRYIFKWTWFIKKDFFFISKDISRGKQNISMNNCFSLRNNDTG